MVMQKRKQLFGEDHPTYNNQGRWKEAEELKVVVMQKRKQLLGEDHPSTLTSMANLAVIRGGGRRQSISCSCLLTASLMAPAARVEGVAP
jgi:hypothetical protein